MSEDPALKQTQERKPPGSRGPLQRSWRAGPSALLVLCLLTATSSPAQPTSPRIGYVYPAGGQRGGTFVATIGGQFLDGVTNAFVSGEGIQAIVVDFNKPMPQGQFNNFRDQLKELQDRKAAARRWPNSTNVWTSDDEKKVADIRGKILKNPPNRQGNPAIAETVTVRVTCATNAEAGQREIRLGTPAGLSNPLVFCVDQLPEFSQPAAKAANPEADRFRERYGKPTTNAPAKSEPRITLPTVINGQIMPGQVDRFRFHARKGQQLVAIGRARELIPYLADAVPGWFQATLALYDTKGKELAYDDDFRFLPDPVLRCGIPKDGDYVIEIKDAIYRGREDFVYRIILGELPFVTSLFPLGGKQGDPTTVTLAGWNLPATNTMPDTETAGIHSLSVSGGNGVSNPMPFAVDTLPETFDQEPNNDAEHAQAITPPIIVNGRVDQPGDADVFRFEGRAGDEFVAEVQARRLRSPLDSVLKLTDAAGNQLAWNDDYEDKASGLNTHHADSYLRATLPASGRYYLYLADTQRKGGEAHAYRLRLGSPQPDFELRVVPSSLSVRAGMSVPVTVYALRKDGFTNEITLTLRGAAEGFTLSGARVPADQDRVRMTLGSPPSPGKKLHRLDLEGQADIRGERVLHPAIPADDMMQAFAYRHLVPARELEVAVLNNGRGISRDGPKILGRTPVQIPVGGTTKIRIAMPAGGFLDRFQFELSDPPEGVALGNVSAVREGAEIVLRGDAVKATPGQSGNLVLNILASRTATAAGQTNRPANNRRATIGNLPAIPFEIIPPPGASGL